MSVQVRVCVVVMEMCVCPGRHGDVCVAGWALGGGRGREVVVWGAGP